MNETEETNRLREAFATLSEVADGGRNCPPPDLLWKAVRGEIGRRRRRRVIDHISECGRCALEWRLAAELVPKHEAKTRTAGDVVRDFFGQFGTFMLRPAWMATAAVALLAVGLWTTMPSNPQLPPRPDTQSVERGLSDANIMSLVPDDEFPRESLTLRWRLKEGLTATEYSVLVSYESNEIASVSGLEEAEWEVPADELAALPVHARVVWQVTAILADGYSVQGVFTTHVK